MTEIVTLLQTIAPLLSKTTLRQMSQVIFGMLVSNGRMTMPGLSRWTEKAASKARKEAKKVAAKPSEKRKRGRPKGSKNKSKQEVVLNAELVRIQTALKTCWRPLATTYRWSMW